MRGGGSGRQSATAGQNVASGVHFNVYLKEAVDDKNPVKLELTDAKGDVLTTFSSKPDKKLKQKKLDLSPGMNRVNWDMRVAGADSFEEVVLWGGGLQGPLVVSGCLHCHAYTGRDIRSRLNLKFAKILGAALRMHDLQAQFDFLIGVRDKLTETHKVITQLREVKSQIEALSKRLEDEQYKAIRDQGKEINERLSAIEKKLYQTQNQSSQDPLNFPIRLNNRLSSLVGVVSTGDNAPTRQSVEVRDLLVGQIDQLLVELKQILSKDVQDFNKKVLEANVPAIFVDDQ